MICYIINSQTVTALVNEIKMKIDNIVQKTGVVKDGMTIGQGFQECVSKDVPGLPYVDSENNVKGCFSISKTLLSACIPEVMVEYADLLGDDSESMIFPEEHADKILSLPANTFLSQECIEIASDTTISKSVALMEKHKVDYLFVVDGGDYIGLVTIDGIARRMLEIDKLKI